MFNKRKCLIICIICCICLFSACSVKEAKTDKNEKADEDVKTEVAEVLVLADDNPHDTDVDEQSLASDTDENKEESSPPEPLINYKLEEVSFPEEAAIDLSLVKTVDGKVLWKREWKNIRLTELAPYSELVETSDYLYIEVFSNLYGLSAETGEDVFDPVMVGAGERPLVDEEGSIYCIGFYGPFATKINREGTVLWQIDHLDDYFWPWKMSNENGYLYIECEQMDSPAINLLQIDNENGRIRNAYGTDNSSIIFETVYSESVLEAYPVTNVLDNDLNTAWVEGETDAGIEQSIIFDHYEVEEISKIVFYNGYHKSQDLYDANNRIKDMQIIFSTGEVLDFQCPDEMQAIEIELERPIQTKQIEFLIKSVYTGSKYNDTAITGIQFY